MNQEQDTTLDTFPKLLASHVKLRPTRDAIREKDLGIWQSWTWAETAAEIRALACGLATLGLKRGDKLAIVGDNRPRLYWGMTAAQALGAIPVPLYQDAVADEMAYVLDNADVKIALVEDQEQIDKILEIRDRCPQLEHLIFDDTRGLRHYQEDFLHDYEKVQQVGVEHDHDHPEFYEQEVAAGSGAEISIMLYTSGTTGNPKGVVLSNDNVIITARNGIVREGLTADEEVLAYLPMAWVGDNLFSYAQSYVAGFCVSCPEDASTVAHDLREIGPTYYFAPPRVYENMLTQVMIRMEDAAEIKRKLFHYFMEHARKVGVRILNRESVSLKDSLLYKLGNMLVYGPLKDVLGLRRTRLAYTAGEAIGPEIFDFYRSLGINIKAGWRGLRRYRRHAGNRCRNQDRRQWRNHVPQPGRIPVLLQESGIHRQHQDRGRLGAYRRRRLLRRTQRSSENHRPRQGRRQAQRRHPVCAEIHRKQAQVLFFRQGSRAVRRWPRSQHRVYQYRSRRGRQLGRAPRPRLFRLYRSGQPRRGLPVDQGMRRQGKPGPVARQPPG
jgi:acyl-coenzyme A synthetase/AMP-(fatty) acid ligase